jgi:hypothetical protein
MLGVLVLELTVRLDPTVYVCCVLCTVHCVLCSVHLYSTVQASLFLVSESLTEYAECWPGPLFDILLNKSYPAG